MLGTSQNGAVRRLTRPTNVMAVSIAIATGVAGCASRIWCNPNTPTSQALAEAQHDCRINPRAAGDINVNTDPHALRGISGAGDVGTSIGQDPYEFAACMQKKGYRYVEKEQCASSANGR